MSPFLPSAAGSVPKFNLEIPHQLGKDEAKSRLERFSDDLQATYKDHLSELEQSWSGDTLSFGFKTFGIRISGDMTVEEIRLLVSGDLPFSAMMFKGKIESEMRERLTKRLQ